MKALLQPYDTSAMLVKEVVFPFTSIIRNNGNGTFQVSALPAWVQTAPVNGIVVTDANNDQKLDIVMTGNDYGNEVFAGRYDACAGIVLLGDGAGRFRYAPATESGFIVDGDGKALAKLRSASEEVIIATQNADSVKVFRTTSDATGRKHFTPSMTEFKADLLFNDGRKQKIEFYHGSGYLSQSSRSMTIPEGVKKIIVYDHAGRSRELDFSGLAHTRR